MIRPTTDAHRLPVPPAGPYILVAVRFRLGAELPNGHIITPRDQETHLVPFPTEDVVPAHLAALCGLVITGDLVELLPGLTGMPCHGCLQHAPWPRRVHMPAKTQTLVICDSGTSSSRN